MKCDKEKQKLRYSFKKEKVERQHEMNMIMICFDISHSDCPPVLHTAHI